MFSKKTGSGAGEPEPAKGRGTASRAAPASAKPVPKTLQTASKGKQAYESRRAQKAGIGLDKWMAEKERRVQAERDAVQRARKQATPAKPGLLRRLLDRAHKPL